jgi:uncharacterized protein (AIM24 family)
MWDLRLHYQLIGDTSQVLEVNLEPQKSLIIDGSALLYADEEIIFELKDDDGTNELQNNPPENSEEEDYEPLDLSCTKFNTQSPKFESNPNLTFQTNQHQSDENEEKEEGLLGKLLEATSKTLSNFFKPKNKKKDKQEENIEIPSLPPEREENIFTSQSPESFPINNNNFEEEVKMPEEKKEISSFSWYLTHCENQSDYIRTIAFTANQGRFVAIDLNEPYENTIIIQNGGFVCARKGIKMNTAFDTDILISKENEKYLKFDSIQGNDYVFLRANGFVIVKDLENDGIKINANALLAYESSLELHWENAEKITAMHTDTENYLVNLTGTGRFWLQTNYNKAIYEQVTNFIPKIPEITNKEENKEVEELIANEQVPNLNDIKNEEDDNKE